MKNLIYALLAISLCTLTFHTFAAGSLGRDSVCQDHAQFVYTVALKGRDSQVPLDQAKKVISEAAGNSPDLPEMMALVDYIYNHPKDKPQALAESYYKHCMEQVEATN